VKKYVVYALITALALSLVGCGQAKKTEVQKLQEIKEVKGSEVTVGDNKINLNDTIIAAGDVSDIKKGNKAYIVSSGDKKYLVIYTGHKETKEKDGIEIIDVVKEAGNDGITLNNGKFYSATPNTTEQTIEDLKNIKKYNSDDFKAGDVVRMLVKDNKIIAIVKY
jgi:PBP1b-binding outer membrane lipoprotein LpoB